MNPQQCLIVEDHPQARDWLCKAATEAFKTTPIETDTLQAAKTKVAEHEIDLAIIDLDLPDGSGHDLIRLLAKKREENKKDITIIVATVMHDDNNVFQAIRHGADGYLLKEESQSNLIEMLRGIFEGRPALSPSVAKRLLQHFRVDSSGDELAPREQEVLQLLAKGFTVAKVGEMLGIKYYTAAGYVKQIYQKLSVNNRAEATIEANRRGLV